MPCVRIKGFGVISFCGTYKPGDPSPTGYLDRIEWANAQHKAGLRQQLCGDCGLWKYPQELSGEVKKSIAETSEGQQVELSSPVCLKCLTGNQSDGG